MTDAYVRVLRNFDEFVTTVDVLKHHVKPLFDESRYLGPSEVKRAFAHVPEKETEHTDILLLHKFKTQGITQQELEDLVDSVEKKDTKRKQLHDDAKGYGQQLGYTEPQMMADIVFRYHGSGTSDIYLLDGMKRVEIIAGCLIMGYYDLETGLTVPEQSLKEPDRGAYDYEGLVEGRNLALHIFDRYLSSGGMKTQSGYESRLTRGTPRQDEKVFQKVRDENSDIPITFGFEPSHCAHGNCVFFYSLKADISALHGKKDMEQRLEQFVTYLKRLKGMS